MDLRAEREEAMFNPRRAALGRAGPLLCGLISGQMLSFGSGPWCGLGSARKAPVQIRKSRWRRLVPVAESLLAAGAYTELQLERRFACRLGAQ
jgi:hypothetical protein